MSSKKEAVKSFAEEGLEAIQEESGAAEATIPVSTDVANVGAEEEMQQVGGLEPVSFFYRFTPPKKETKTPWKILEKGTTILGIYDRSFSGGKFKNQTHLVRLADKSLIGLPGAGSLQRAIEKLAPGSKVKITYDGMSTIKGGEWEGNDAHNFTVFGSRLKTS